MAETAEMVAGIEEKIYRMIAAHRQLTVENENLSRENEAISRQLDEQKQINEALEKKLNILKTVKTIENKGGTAESKAQIGRLLREIDKCIGLLNG